VVHPVNQFAGSKDHGGAMFQDPVIGKSFYDYFCSNAINIAATDANNRFLHVSYFALKIKNKKNRI
jgi:hypothetical protein